MSIKKIDYSILEFIQLNIKNPVLDKAMVIITRLGDASIIWIITAILFFVSERYRKDGIVIIAAQILCFIIGNLILKNIFGRARPFDTYVKEDLLITRPRDFSFPSGHTMSSIAAAVVIFNADYKLGIIAWIIALLIAFSRMYLYVHYPSDVAAGVVIGFLIGIFTVYISNIEYINQIMDFRVYLLSLINSL